jgi:hypothetical protein
MIWPVRRIICIKRSLAFRVKVQRGHERTHTNDTTDIQTIDTIDLDNDLGFRDIFFNSHDIVSLLSYQIWKLFRLYNIFVYYIF